MNLCRAQTTYETLEARNCFPEKQLKFSVQTFRRTRGQSNIDRLFFENKLTLRLYKRLPNCLQK